MANTSSTNIILPQLVRSDKIQKRLAEVFVNAKEVAAQTASIIATYNQNPKLAQCDPNSIVSAAVQAALLKLPLSTQLGYAYVLPYYSGGKMVAQLQIGWKGFVQLAIRSGQYLTINASPLYEGEIEKINRITGEITFGEKTGDNVIGYVAYFKLINGFEKTLYMTREQVENHAAQFSDGYKYDLKSGKSSSVWNKNFDAMATKTVLKRLISRYGIVSLDMQQALAADQSAVEKNQFTYVDNGNYTVPRDATITVDSEPIEETPTDAEEAPWETVDSETGEVKDIFNK